MPLYVNPKKQRALLKMPEGRVAAQECADRRSIETFYSIRKPKILDTYGIIKVLRLITGALSLTPLVPCYTIYGRPFCQSVMSLSNLHGTTRRAFCCPSQWRATMAHRTHTLPEVRLISKRNDLHVIGYTNVCGLMIPVFGRKDADRTRIPSWIDDIDPVNERPLIWDTRAMREWKIKRNGGSHTKEEWEALCEAHENRCVCCRKSGVKLTRDHIIPVSRGGSDNISNIQPLCVSCNSRKSVKTEDYR